MEPPVVVFFGEVLTHFLLNHIDLPPGETELEDITTPDILQAS